MRWLSVSRNYCDRETDDTSGKSLSG